MCTYTDLLLLAGGAGAGVHGHLHCGDVHQDYSHGLCAPPRLLPAEPLEHHGLCRRSVGVSYHVAFVVLYSVHNTVLCIHVLHLWCCGGSYVRFFGKESMAPTFGPTL